MLPRILAAFVAASGAVAQAADVRLCTDRGGLLATEAEDGSLDGVLQTWTVRGTRDAMELVDGHGDVVWSGPLASLDPGAAPEIDPAAVARRFEALVPGLDARGAAVRGLGFHGEVGPDGALRGAWRDGTVVVYALGLGEDGLFGGPAALDAPLAALPGALAPASSSDPLTGGRPASRAAALGRLVTDHLEEVDVITACPLGGPHRLWVGAWPQPIPLAPGETVTWTSAEAALVRSPTSSTLYRAVRDTGGVMLDATEIPLTPLTAPGPATSEPVHGPGREMVAHLNARRADHGLDPVAWDDTLAWSAMSQCAYLDWSARTGLHDAPSRQDPASPVHVGEWPPDRGGGIEVSARSTAPPWSVVDRWLEDPRHRGALLDPRADRVGACATANGARVIDVIGNPAHTRAVRTLPANGDSAVPLAWAPDDGFPAHLTGPAGSALSAWVGADARVVSTALEASGQPLAHVVIATTAAERGVAVVHLVPRAPYLPDTVYKWEVVLEVGGDVQIIRRRFRTAPAATVVVAP